MHSPHLKQTCHTLTISPGPFLQWTCCPNTGFMKTTVELKPKGKGKDSAALLSLDTYQVHHYGH